MKHRSNLDPESVNLTIVHSDRTPFNRHKMANGTGTDFPSNGVSFVVGILHFHLARVCYSSPSLTSSSGIDIANGANPAVIGEIL